MLTLLACLLGMFLAAQEEDQVDSSTIAPGVAPKMSAAKAAKSVVEKEARIAVRSVNTKSHRPMIYSATSFCFTLLLAALLPLYL